MSVIQEFKAFIAKGNVMDLAVGVIIGAAFGKIVDSMVKDVITPMIGMAGGQPDFSAIKAGPILIGNFANAVVAFLILAAVVFFVLVKPMNKLMAAAMKKAEEKPAEAPPIPEDVKLLMEIRDLLKTSRAP
jgi:large conductance mechanosensitive channel